MTRLFINLSDDESEALAQIAYAELRDPRAQAVIFIRVELERRGLLPITVTRAEGDEENGARDEIPA